MPLRSKIYPVTPTLSVEALHDRLAPVEPATAPVRPMGVEGGVVSTEGVVPAALVVSASPTPLQPASSIVVMVAARSKKAFMRNMESLLLGRHTHYLGRHSERLPVSKINDTYRKSTTLSVCRWHMTTVCKRSSMQRTFPPAFARLCQKSPIAPPMSSEDDTSSPLGKRSRLRW